MGAMFPFFQSPGASPDCHDLSSIMETGLATASANSLRTPWFYDPGMHLTRSHRLMYVRVLQAVTNLIFSYSQRDLALPVPALWSIHSRGVGREVASKDWGKKRCWVPQPSPHPLSRTQLLPVNFFTRSLLHCSLLQDKLIVYLKGGVLLFVFK